MRDYRQTVESYNSGSTECQYSRNFTNSLSIEIIQNREVKNKSIYLAVSYFWIPSSVTEQNTFQFSLIDATWNEHRL